MKRRLFIGLILVFLGVGTFVPSVVSANAPRITKDELKALLGNPDLVIVDVRSGGDWTDADSKIQGAIREEPDQINSWANKYSKDKILVLYCA